MATGIGVFMTIVMRSSSAAVATLTALHANVINLSRPPLVIGAAIGTTITGAMVAIGGSVSAKRTALAHIVFNLTTGVFTLALLPVFLGGLALAQQQVGLDSGPVSLAVFHTTFIALGVMIFLPFSRSYARWIERWLPERGPRLARHLDDTLLQAPAVALESTRRALVNTALEIIDQLNKLLGSAVARVVTERMEIKEALDKTQRFCKNSAVPMITPCLIRASLSYAIDHRCACILSGLRTTTHKAQPPLQGL